MNIKLYKAALKNEYKNVLDYILMYGGKFGLISKDLLINELVKYDSTKSQTYYKRAIKDLVEVDILKSQMVNSITYIYMSTSTYRELNNSKGNVDVNLFNHYHYSICDFKIKSLNRYLNKKVDNASIYSFYENNFKYQLCFNKSNNNFTRIENDLGINIKNDILQLESYNVSFLGVSDNYITFAFYGIDKENSSYIKSLSNLFKVYDIVKNISYFIDTNKKIRFCFFIKKEDNAKFCTKLKSMNIKKLEEQENLKNISKKIYLVD